MALVSFFANSSITVFELPIVDNVIHFSHEVDYKFDRINLVNMHEIDFLCYMSIADGNQGIFDLTIVGSDIKIFELDSPIGIGDFRWINFGN